MDYFDAEFQNRFVFGLIEFAVFSAGVAVQLLFCLIAKSKAVQFIPTAISKAAVSGTLLIGFLLIGLAISSQSLAALLIGIAVLVLYILPAAFCFGNAVAWIIYAIIRSLTVKNQYNKYNYQ